MDLYKQGNYNEVIRRCEFALNKYPDSEYVPKYRFLKALSMGEIYGVTILKPELEKIQKEFKLDPVSKRSEDLLAAIKENELKNLGDFNLSEKSDTSEKDIEIEKIITQKTLEEIEKIYSFNPESKHSFALVIANEADINQLKFNIINFNLDFYIQESFDIESKEFNEFSTIITVKQFKNAEVADEYYSKFDTEKEKLFTDVKSTEYKFFIISDENLTNLTKEKMVRDYLLFYQINYKE